ncbi:Mitogen-activated protein kinase kinase kinase [Sesamum alatum]|uniref:Mitogen-activated protein kinase kinase kinase n=1 Tax=Sesamum alatum TaxID=300844 RepID=A0AAE1XQR9_9LAMI|nr:Mitogen-activated protein kinase kinase kinase [Sesamum alatum]
MHWWQGAFTSVTKSHSDDDSVIIGDGAAGATRYSVKTGFFFFAEESPPHARSGNLRQGENDVDGWRSANHLQNLPVRSAVASASPSPLPLPLPELRVLLQRDHKFASSSSCSVPLPSPDAVQVPRGIEEKERDREMPDAVNGEAVDGGHNGPKSRLYGQDMRTNAAHSENRRPKKSQSKLNAKERSTETQSINIPISAPTSPYSSPMLSPPRNDMYTTLPGVFQNWSAPEMPHPDGNGGLGFSYQVCSERTTSSIDSSPLQSPRVSCNMPASSPPGPASPLNTRLSSESPLPRWESNGQATVHPLPLPPGAAMSSQPAPISPAGSKSDFPGASTPSQSSPLSSFAAKPEFTGASIPSQPYPLSPVGSKCVKSQWQKGKLIGRGTFGSVYVASNRETGALCAMKEVEILPDDSKSAECMRQLEQEIKVLSHLKHPNIVQYYGSEIVGDKFYIYLEYVHPGSISKFINDHCGAITESVVRNFTRHILSGLAYLHSKKTIHRDIKGANLLVDAYGVVKLADFGMAKHLNGQTANLSLKGSPYWMAPELLQSAMQTDGNCDVALAVDIWSLGCTIIEMMNGKPPWSEYEGAAALFKVLKETPPIPETLSAEGKDFLQCCFRRNPADRPSASKLLDHPFMSYSHQSDAPQSLKETRFMDNMQFLSDRPRHRLDQLPEPFDMQIKKGKLSNNESRQGSRLQTFHLAASVLPSPRVVTYGRPQPTTVSGLPLEGSLRPIVLARHIEKLGFWEFLGVAISFSSSQLDYKFYDNTCPNLAKIVRNGVLSAIANETRIAASLLRLHFHDCFVDGCEGSVLLDDSSNFTGEKNAFPNRNSARGFEVIDAIKENVERACPSTVSCSDILTLAARDAVFLTGGPFWPVALGRRDGLMANETAANTDLPSPFEPLENITAKFVAKGLDFKDMVVLSGGHTIGFAQCFTFKPRLFNFDGAGNPDPILDESLLGSLRSVCPNQDDSDTNLVALDAATSGKFDNSYFRSLVNNSGILQSDQDLMGDNQTAALVLSYSKFPFLFSRDFGKSMAKMSCIGVLTGQEGEIRKNCRVVN